MDKQHKRFIELNTWPEPAKRMKTAVSWGKLMINHDKNLGKPLHRRAAAECDRLGTILQGLVLANGGEMTGEVGMVSHSADTYHVISS